jgi:hypothetical protein
MKLRYMLFILVLLLLVNLVVASETSEERDLTSLINTTYQPTSITWTWTSPSDPDFYTAIVFLNGVFMTNITDGTGVYHAKGLNPDTEYTIGTKTVDNHGNISATWLNHTARTAGLVTGPQVIPNSNNSLAPFNKALNESRPMAFVSRFNPVGRTVPVTGGTGVENISGNVMKNVSHAGVPVEEQRTSITPASAVTSINGPSGESHDILKGAIFGASAPGWQSSTVDSAGNVGGGSSIALNSSGYPRISYYNATGRDLKYAKWTGSAWQIINLATTGEVGDYPSLALDEMSGWARISYYNATGGNLMYVREFGGSIWQTVTVDSTGDVGMYTSIALDSSGNPHISYYNATGGDLKYAKWTGSMWVTDTVDSADNVGWYTSLALDSYNYPHIAYYDVSTWDLKYAKWKEALGWDIQTVDESDTEALGQYASLVLDESNKPCISYYDATNHQLKYAKETGIEYWSKEIVDSSGDVGKFTSIALDSSGNPHISYYNTTSGELKYAKRTGVRTWQIETVEDSSYDVGAYTSLALDAADNPHVSYYDRSHNYLKYAVNPKHDSIGIFRDGFWILDYNGDFQWSDVGTGNDLVAGFGQAGDNPVVGNWNHTTSGDKIGVFRNGIWLIDYNGNFQWDGVDKYANLGQAGDIPVVGDWNSYHDKKIGVFRDGFWILDKNGNYQWEGSGLDVIAGFGHAGDIPVVGDWYGTDQDKIGVFRNGFWILDKNGNFQWDGIGTGADLVAGFGASGDIPVVRDWNGDHMPEIAVFRPSSGQWIIDNNGNYQWDGTAAGQDVTVSLGQSGDVAIAGDWNSNSKDKIGIFRDGFWIIDYNGNHRWDGPPDDKVAGFGQAGDIPVTGKFI